MLGDMTIYINCSSHAKYGASRFVYSVLRHHLPLANTAYEVAMIDDSHQCILTPRLCVTAVRSACVRSKNLSTKRVHSVRCHTFSEPVNLAILQLIQYRCHLNRAIRRGTRVIGVMHSIAIWEVRYDSRSSFFVDLKAP